MQAQYKPREMPLTLQSAIRNGEYIETFVRNNDSSRVPSGDTIYRRLSESLNFQRLQKEWRCRSRRKIFYILW